jgi:hypothetical protein
MPNTFDNLFREEISRRAAEKFASHRRPPVTLDQKLALMIEQLEQMMVEVKALQDRLDG